MTLQLVFNSIVSGCLLALVAIAFNLVFHVTKVFHLAQGALYVAGPYGFMEILSVWDRPGRIGQTVVAVAGALLLVLFLSWLLERLLYQRLAKKNSGQAITLISSMGAYLFLVNLIALLFGNEKRSLPDALGDGFYALGDSHYTLGDGLSSLGKGLSFSSLIILPVQLLQLVVPAILLGGFLLFGRTNWYLNVKAAVSNTTVALLLGVKIKRVRLVVLAIAGVFITTASLLRLFDTGIDPYSGMEITLSAAVAVIAGGGTSLTGTIVAAFLISFLQTSTEWFLSSPWKQGITFLVLILVVLFRTEGLVSFKMRMEEK